MCWTTKVFLGVAAAHILVLAVLIFYPISSTKRFEASRVATVDLLEPAEAEVRPAAKEEPAPPAEPPPPPPAPPKPEAEQRPAPPKVIRRVETLPPPTSDLRQRLAQRLSEIKPESRPAVAADRRSAVSGDEKFPFGWYEDYLVRRLYELWEQPGRGAVRSDQAAALISFRIQRDGRIEGIILRKTSGSSLLDQSALEAVRRADPLPPLPEGFRGPWREVNILFELTD